MDNEIIQLTGEAPNYIGTSAPKDEQGNIITASQQFDAIMAAENKKAAQILGLDPPVFYGIVAVGSIIIVTALYFVFRKKTKGKAKSKANND